MKKLSPIIAFCLITTSCFAAGELTSYTKVKWMGLNVRVNPQLLQDDEATAASNITLQETGAIQDRNTFQQYNTSSGILGSNFITGLFKYYSISATYFIGCAGANVALGSAGAFTTDITPSTNTVVPGKYWSAVTFNNKEYMFNPSVPMMIYDTVKTGLYPPLSTPATNCAFSAVHKNRVWAARSDSMPYRIYWSSLTNAEEWTTTGGYVDLPDISQSITGLISWGGYLFVFTETNIYIVQGSTPNDFSIRKSNSQVGAIAPRSIRITDIGIMFLSRSGIFSFDGNTSLKLSDKVEPLINDISPVQIQNSCSIYDGQGKYWLAYPYRTSSYNNKILIYDTILKEWYPYDGLNVSYFERAYGGTDKWEIYSGSAIPTGIVYSLQPTTGMESVTHSTESDFLTGTTFNTVILKSGGIQSLNGNDTKTVFLSHFNGQNGTPPGSQLTAETGQLMSFYNSAQLSTGTKEFGTASLYLQSASSDYVTIPTSTDFDFGSGDFTIDFWVKLNTIGAVQIILSDWQTGNDRWMVYLGADNKLYFLDVTATVTQADFNTTNAAITDITTWHHVAVVRNGSAPYIFVDGASVPVTITTALGTFGAKISPIYIGQTSDGRFYLNGYLDEIRISKGLARWIGDFNPYNVEYDYTRMTGLLHSANLQINSSTSKTLGNINWTGNTPTQTNITFQTRSGPTDDTVDFANWQGWVSTNTVTFDTVTDSTAFTSSDNNLIVRHPSTNQLRYITYYEDEKDPSPNSVEFQVYGSVSYDKYADETIPVKDLSSYNWLTGWCKSPETGNTVVLSFGQASPTENRISINTVNVNTWEKWYWYIGDIAAASKTNVNQVRVTYKGETAGSVFLSNIDAQNFYNSGDTMTSSPNDFIQYRAILGADFYTDRVDAPELDTITLVYTPTGTAEGAFSSSYDTKHINFGTPQVSKQYLEFLVDVNTTSDSELHPIYFDYDIDNGTQTGTITINSTDMVTDNTVKIRKYFPSNIFGKTMQINYRNPDAKTSKHTLESMEIRYRTEPIN